MNRTFWKNPAQLSGASRILANTAKFLLLPLSCLYTAGVETRNILYDLHQLPRHSLPRPVISVGNLTVGGTGKTPMVEFLANWYAENDRRIAILTRGYGSQKTEGASSHDEPLPEHLSSKPIQQFPNPDRYAASQKALESFRPDLFLMDDGYQHRALKRDLDIVLVNAIEGIGNGCVLPAGPLREPACRLNRADVLVLSHSNRISENQTSKLVSRLKNHLSGSTPIVHAVHQPDRVLQFENGSSVKTHPPEYLEGKSLLAYCGIGTPESFRNTLTDLQVEQTEFVTYPDHHNYTNRELEILEDKAKNQSCRGLVTTRKDAVKSKNRISQPLFVVEISIQFSTGWNKLEERLRELLTYSHQYR